MEEKQSWNSIRTGLCFVMVSKFYVNDFHLVFFFEISVLENFIYDYCIYIIFASFPLPSSPSESTLPFLELIAAYSLIIIVPYIHTNLWI